MQISDFLGQFKNSSPVKIPEGIMANKGVENHVSSLSSLTKGNIFEGTVSSVKGGRVTLSLSNGTQISARLDGKISLSAGQSMFFQVKSNDGSQIAIRPFIVDGGGGNYALMQALQSAGLAVSSNYLSMVNKMMEEQMPIDRASLQQMARLVNANSGIDVQTLVQMNKLGIPITPENASQFENYLGDKQAITAELENLIDELPTAMQGESLPVDELKMMNAQVLEIITEGLAENGAAGEVNLLMQEEIPQEAPALDETGQEVQADGKIPVQSDAPGSEAVQSAESQATGAEGGENVQAGQDQTEAGQTVAAESENAGAVNSAAGQTTGAESGENVQAGQDQTEAGQSVAAEGESGGALPSADGQAVSTENKAQVRPENSQEDDFKPGGSPAETGQAEGTASGGTVRPGGDLEGNVARLPERAPAVEEHTLKAVLNENELSNLNKMLGNLLGRDSVNYTPQRDTVGVLRDLQELFKSELPVERDGLQKLLASDEFKKLVKDTLEQQWTIKPEELTGSSKINKLYEKLDNQMEKMSNVMRATGQENTNFNQLATDIRSNVEFMNQINQAYTYVQIPLKMSGQNASGELYVYTNKKALSQGDGELSAFLHLDMDHLGSTDVSVRMRGREVSTNFYLENDEAYDLLEKHLPILEERLKAKGYNCKISVTNESKHVNFVEDFLKKDQPSAGKLHRYTFDMRA